MNTYNLLDSIKLKTIYGELPSEIKEIHVDSRKVTEGSMFVCTRGYTVDGHDYAQMAIEKGATLLNGIAPFYMFTLPLLLVRS